MKDLVAAPFQMDNLLSAVTQFMNLLLKGVCPPTVAPFFFGGRLVALSKKGGGVRPIAVSNVWKRLASKCALSSVLDKIKLLLYPLQLGVGVHGGAETVIHSVRGLMQNLPIN